MNTTDLNSTGDHVDLAGYLLDALSPAQKAEVDAHLADCAACRAEVDSLREWTMALEAVPEAMLLDGPPEGGDLLLQRTLREIRQEVAAGRRWRTALLSSAAVVAALAVIAGGVFAGRATAPSTPEALPTTVAPAPSTAAPGTRTATSVDPTTGARLTVAVTPAAGWVRVNAAVSGVPAGEKCLLEVVGKDGKSVLAGSWMVSAAGATAGTTVDGSALIDPDQVAAVRVVTTDGKQYASTTLL